jgi:hypothetical protein
VTTEGKWISQNLSYATVVGVRWCVLTNGDEYRIYNSHAAVDVEQKLFRSVRTSDPTNTNYVMDTLQLLSKEQMQGRLLDELWKLHFIDGNVSRSIESLLANEDPGLVRLVCNSLQEGEGRYFRRSPCIPQTSKDSNRLPGAGTPWTNVACAILDAWKTRGWCIAWVIAARQGAIPGAASHFRYKP